VVGPQGSIVAGYARSMLTVLDLADEVVAATRDDPEGSALTVATILRLLDVTGPFNTHLANPLNHPLRYYPKPRETALSGKEPVYGAFLALVYSAHDPFVRLESFDGIELLEQFLGSNSNVVNPFITYCAEFVAGRVRA